MKQNDRYPVTLDGRYFVVRGGKARAEALTKKQHSEIAKKAAESRWKTKS